MIEFFAVEVITQILATETSSDTIQLNSFLCVTLSKALIELKMYNCHPDQTLRLLFLFHITEILIYFEAIPSYL